MATVWLLPTQPLFNICHIKCSSMFLRVHAINYLKKNKNVIKEAVQQ